MNPEDTPFEQELRTAMQAIEVIYESDVALVFKLAALNRINEFVFTAKDALYVEAWGPVGSEESHEHAG